MIFKSNSQIEGFIQKKLGFYNFCINILIVEKLLYTPTLLPPPPSPPPPPKKNCLITQV